MKTTQKERLIGMNTREVNLLLLLLLPLFLYSCSKEEQTQDELQVHYSSQKSNGDEHQRSRGSVLHKPPPVEVEFPGQQVSKDRYIGTLQCTLNSLQVFIVRKTGLVKHVRVSQGPEHFCAAQKLHRGLENE